MRILLAALLLATPAAADPFGRANVASDGELATMRGGFALPNGLDLAVGVVIETMVDGQLALRTVFSTTEGLRAFTGGQSENQWSPKADATPVTTQGPTIIIDRNGAGVVVQPGWVAPNVQVGVGRGAITPAAAAAGGTEVILPADGSSTATPFGSVRLEQGANGQQVVLEGSMLEIRQLVGAATGVAIINSADNRSIDSVATVHIDLANASPLIGSNILMIDSLAARSVAERNGL